MRNALLTLALLASGAAAHSAFPVRVAHERGTVEFRSAPKRIVVLEYSFTDNLLALGVKPVGMAKDATVPSYFEARVRDVPGVGTRAQPNLEAIVALRPDLIIADLSRHRQSYEQLSRVAPTLMWNSVNGTYDEMLSQVSKMGALLGKADVARTLLADQERLLAKARTVTRKNASLVVGLMGTVTSEPGLIVASTGTLQGSLFEKLGRSVPTKPQAGAGFYALSLEGLASVNPSAIVLMLFPADLPAYQAYQKNPLWQKLDAVKANRVYVVDRGLWSFGRGILALKKIHGEMLANGVLTNAPAR